MWNNKQVELFCPIRTGEEKPSIIYYDIVQAKYIHFYISYVDTVSQQQMALMHRRYLLTVLALKLTSNVKRN